MNEVISKILQNRAAVVGGSVVAGAAAGLFLGYRIGYRRGVDDLLEAVQENWIDAEECPDFVEPEDDGGPEDDPFDQKVETTEDLLDEPQPSIVEELPDEPQSPMVRYDEIIERARYFKKAKDESMDNPNAVKSNVFEHTEAAPAEEWDYDVEDKYRELHPDGPYPIHIDEFTRNDLGFRQETLTYYTLDDILAGQDDVPIHNFRKLTGELRWGHGSNDSDVVYIRNAAIRMEWEILRHESSFAAEVHGIELEEQYEEQDLKHSADRKFRLEG